jgi:glycosyltransferase involved in cell wall biosynthesis
MMRPGISIVIPNYNGKDLLERNIPSVFNALITSDITDFEIIVAEDASKDNSVEFLKSNYPEIILIENKVNKGFGKIFIPFNLELAAMLGNSSISN